MFAEIVQLKHPCEWIGIPYCSCLADSKAEIESNVSPSRRPGATCATEMFFPLQGMNPVQNCQSTFVHVLYPRKTYSPLLAAALIPGQGDRTI